MNSLLVIGLILASTLSISALAEAKSSPTPPPSSSGGGDFRQKAQKKESTRWIRWSSQLLNLLLLQNS